jgi:hypothetical protein
MSFLIPAVLLGVSASEGAGDGGASGAPVDLAALINSAILKERAQSVQMAADSMNILKSWMEGKNEEFEWRKAEDGVEDDAKRSQNVKRAAGQESAPHHEASIGSEEGESEKNKGEVEASVCFIMCFESSFAVLRLFG